jgi:alanine racemase
VNRPDKNKPFLEISLDNILHNLGEIRRVIPPEKGVIAVVKDCAYGCGSVPVSRFLEANAVAFLAVACVDEAVVLREAGITSPILVLGPCDLRGLAWGATRNIVFSLNDVSDVGAWRSAAAAVRFHLNIDTGMGRLGIAPAQTSEIIAEIKKNKNLFCEGAYTHLASADVPGTGTVGRQLRRFAESVSLLTAGGISLPHIHYANSAGLMRFPLSPDCTLVRPGITLYGCKPDPCQQFPLNLKSAVTLKAPVVKIKRVAAGTPISYGGRYVTSTETHIASIPLGYGIGLPRGLTGKGSVLINGRRYAIAGTVTMDYVMADVGASPDVSVGDEAVAIGCQGGECISPDEVALSCGTIAYEILCGLSARLDRYYIYKGAISERIAGRPF